MNLEQFSKQIRPLVDRFKKAYTPDLISLIFAEVKHLSEEAFSKVVIHLLGNSRGTPMVPDFRRAITDLNLASPIDSFTPTYRVRPSELYHIRDNIYASHDQIFIRAKEVGSCGFIWKKDHPDHPYVIEDKETRKRLRI